MRGTFTMGPTKNWLIATYGTKYAMASLKHAAYLCTMMNVLPKVTILVVSEDRKAELEAAAILEEAHQVFDDIVLGRVSPDMELRIGEPAKEILMAAREGNIDQLFMGAGDFKYDINTNSSSGGISNQILNGFHGVITLVK